MQIRSRLTLQFILIVALILIVSSIAIYYSSAEYREREFYDRLETKANTTARLLIDVDEVDEKLLKVIEANNFGILPQERIKIYNYKNERLFSTDHDSSISVTPELLDIIRLEEHIEFQDGEYEVLGVLFKGQYDRFVVIAGAVDKYGFSKLRNLRNILLIVFGLSLLIASILAWIYSGRALRPISRVVDQVKNISASNLSARVDEGNKRDEIAQLSATFNKMLERLETSFTIQKNFVANASHELRTPLTVVTGQIEVTLLSKRERSEYEQTLRSILEDIRNLNTLSNRLLMLAHASSETAETKMSKLRIDDVIWQARTELLKSHAEYKINIQFQNAPDTEDHWIIEGNEQLLISAVKNLMENACKFSADNQVDVVLGFLENNIELQFIDHGVGIAPQELPNIFQPFYRSNNAMGIHGHGIGLSLVDKIISMHDGEIKVHSEPAKITVFTIILPKFHF